MINCLFSGNEGSFGCLSVDPESTDQVLIANCTVVGNLSLYSSGTAVGAGGANTSVVNCIIWDNAYGKSRGQDSQIGAASVLANNCVQGWDGSLGGEGNFGDDPLMIDPDGPDDIYGTEDDDPRLADNSPCRDVGANSFLPVDDFDLDQDGNTNEPVPLDLDSLRRVVNNTVDIGAYEWQSACPPDVAPSSPGQAGDGDVSVLDLLAVINAWGDCDFCAADINADGMVNVQDLLLVITDWGPCG